MSKIAHFSNSVLPEAVNFHREIISHHRFDTVTHIRQITNFDTLWEPWRLNWGPKRSKIADPTNNNSQKLQICMCR